VKRMVEYYARERGGIGWRWQAMDSKNSPAPVGGAKTGKNPTDRGKRGAKINLLVDQSGAPLSVVLTGANRHDKVVAIDLIVSIALKRPAHKEQHLCADKAYDASEVREFAASEGYSAHIKANPRTADGEDLKEKEGAREEVGSGAHDIVVDQTSRSAHPLVQEEVRELVSVDSVGLRSRSAQLGGFRIESYSPPTVLGLAFYRRKPL